METNKRKRRRKRRKKKKKKKKEKQQQRMKRSLALPHPPSHRHSSSSPPPDWVKSACSSFSFFSFFFHICLFWFNFIVRIGFCFVFYVWIIWDVFWEWSKVRSACSSQQLCFFFFCSFVFFVFFFFLRFRFKGNREKQFDHGSKNRAIEPRFERFPFFLA